MGKEEMVRMRKKRQHPASESIEAKMAIHSLLSRRFLPRTASQSSGAERRHAADFAILQVLYVQTGDRE
jgi:hypothetical protein